MSIKETLFKSFSLKIDSGPTNSDVAKAGGNKEKVCFIKFEFLIKTENC